MEKKPLRTANFKTFTSHRYYLRSILVANGLESTFHLSNILSKSRTKKLLIC